MLPDAHTNVFKLVDLPGIKWTKYSFANPLPCLPGDDQILSAFAKCMREGILCTWRRPMDGCREESPSSEHKKELWCFWWGEKPALLESFKEKGLESSDESVVEWSGNSDGMPYVQRTLLFKALHNSVERKLCSEGWTRMGRWFFRTPDGDKVSKSAAFSISFFLNGSVVCCSIEPGQAPAVTRLRPSNPALQSEIHPIEVITAPWGLRGFFSGKFLRAHHHDSSLANDSWSSWREFYPFALPTAREDENEDEPFAVELALGSQVSAFRVVYPARLVFVPQNQEELCLPKLRPEKAKIENVVREVAKNAAIDMNPRVPTVPGHAPEAVTEIAPSFDDRRCRRLVKNLTKRPARWARHKSPFHKRNSDSPRRNDMMFEDIVNQDLNAPESNPPTNSTTQSSNSPTTPTDVDDVKDQLLQPPSPIYYRPTVPSWNGLKFPIDSTGQGLKTDRCRPKLEVDDIANDSMLFSSVNRSTFDMFPEFKPRKRLKKSRISEVNDFQPPRRAPAEAIFDLSPVKTEPSPFDSSSMMDHNPISLTKAIVNGYAEKKPKDEPDDNPYVNILTPSPDDPSAFGVKPRYTRIRHPSPSHLTTRLTHKDTEFLTDTSFMLTPPGPEPEDEDEGVFAAVRLQKDKADELVIEPSYRPSWKEGSRSHQFKEQMKQKEQVKQQQEQIRRQAQVQPVQLTSTRPPNTPGAPRTPGISGGPGTPGHAPQTPGNPTTPGYQNPHSVGGPPSVGTYPHTPGSTRIGINLRSPGAAIPPSPASILSRDFNAPKTPRDNQGLPRTPRTPRSCLTPGKAGPGSVGIRGVASLPEASALLLNLILGDSVLDAHRDRNFIQAPLCSCKQGRADYIGSDGHLIGMKLETKGVSNMDNDDDCSCGFSAIASRSSAIGTWGGLFLEDEIKMAGEKIEEEVVHNNQRDFLDESLRTTPEIITKAGIAGVPKPKVNLVAKMLRVLINTTRSRNMTTTDAAEFFHPYILNYALYWDACNATSDALKNARSAVQQSAASDRESLIHFGHDVSQDVVTRYSLPYQDSLQHAPTSEVVRLLGYLKPVLQDAVQKRGVEGPLTWADLVRAGRRSVNFDEIEPLPVPQLQSMSSAVHNELLRLAPSSIQFSKELSLAPVGMKKDVFYIVILPNSDVILSKAKRWFPELSAAYTRNNFGLHKPLPLPSRKNRKSANFIRLVQDTTSFSERYRQTFTSEVSPVLQNLHFKKQYGLDWSKHAATLDQGRPGPPYDQSRQRKDSMNPEHPKNKTLIDGDISQLIIYVFEPTQSKDSEHPKNLLEIQNRERMMHALPEQWKLRTQIKFLPASFLATSDSVQFSRIALETYNQCLTPMDKALKPEKSFTGFGPTRDRIERKDAVYTENQETPCVTLREPEVDLSGDVENFSQIIYCSYFPSQDQRWVLVSCTDSFGKNVETNVISIDVPARYLMSRRQKKYHLIQRALLQVWDFTREFADRTFNDGHIRIVVTRIGRLGFGETVEWTKLMTVSKKWTNWTQRSTPPQSNQTSPKLSLVSAYLTSIEPDATIRIVQDPNRSAKAIAASKSGVLRPEEVQSAHIAVFATTPSARESTNEEKNSTVQDSDFNLGFDMPEENPVFGGNDEFNVNDIVNDIDLDGIDDSDAPFELMHQPLSVALWISQALMPIGMPQWFGPLNRNEPTTLRVALHMQAKSELMDRQHALDKPDTVFCLRYIVENLERLSWLSTKPSGRSLSRTALPHHIAALAELHRSLVSLTSRVVQLSPLPSSQQL